MLSGLPQLQEFEQNWAEPLHEYTQFASIIKKLLQYRHQKHVQYEMTQEALEAKREQLEELEKSEREARRLEEALNQGRPSTLRTSTSLGSDGVEGEQQPEGEGGPSHRQEESVYLPPHPGPNPVKRRAPGMGLLSALSYTLHGMMDVDPETARRNSITKTKETISQVRGQERDWQAKLTLTPRDSWKTPSTWLRRISSIRARRYRPTWTGSSDKRWLTCARWRSAWQGAIGTGVRR